MCVTVKFVNKGIYPYMYMYFILLETVKDKERLFPAVEKNL